MKDRHLEITRLKAQIARLTEEARKNEDTWRRSQQREMALLEAEDLPELFRHLTEGLRRSYALQATSVSLSDPEHEIRNLLHVQGREPGDFANIVFAESTTGLVTRMRARPWLGPYREAVHGPLFDGHADLESVALLPLVRQTRVIGSLNFGSADPDRFTDEHATDFLRHLASIAAFGLENIVNRARLIQSGFTDALTGWHNRAYLENRLGEELIRSQREQTSIVCLLLDVDHFKRVNDRHGHAAGDDVLREVARRISTKIRGSDISARYGGEEFIVLLPRTPLEAGRLLAERIRDAVSSEPFAVGSPAQSLTITVSIGLAEYRPTDSGTASDDATERAGRRLVAEADAALYEAKAAGRNTVALAAA